MFLLLLQEAEEASIRFQAMFPKGSYDLCVQLRSLCPIRGKSLPNTKRLVKIATLPALTFTSSYSIITYVARSTLCGS